MQRLGLLFGFAALLLGAPLGVGAQGFDDAPWQRVLEKYVSDTGRVDYAALKANPGDLDQFVAELAGRSPATNPQDFPTREDQLAYWINAYNALAIKGVVDNWPVRSVRDIGRLPYSFFWHKKFTVGGKSMTLDAIEGILRGPLHEPRIHFAIVCASNSCPRLRRHPYTPKKADEQLDAAAREFINQPRNLQIDPRKNQVTLARIFGFYRGDFEAYAREKQLSGTGEPVLDYILLYASAENRKAVEALRHPAVKQFAYDWGVNDIHRPGPTANSTKEGEDP